MRRLALTVAVVVAVGIGGWWRANSAPAPIAPARGVVGASEVATGTGGAYPPVERGAAIRLSALPRFPETVWREAATLNERRFVTWSVASRPGGRYLLQYVCLTQGELHVRVRGTVETWSKSVSCPGPFRSVRIVASGDHLTIMARRLNHRHVEVALQMVALP
ncbi:hypothetical protein I0C86_27580 [Plantactinospora sp. S1510]|uniref:Uncharacterized protein n=1 Tax=Plantactinospora alkalitolerans TaxID=2789879 RepID=A0ABS0H3J2_9ACTN|nr:hypothetical protein [Plantactinospora alkalitolerans]MBF9132687.1 hypothetical protein [Plantactinospora alkalitolerans]